MENELKRRQTHKSNFQTMREKMNELLAYTKD